MTNREIVTAFLTSYQRHDYRGMHACLDPKVEFRDMAYESITGPRVQAMWRWFCEPTETRKAIDVPGFEIMKAEGDHVHAEYWVRYSPEPGKTVNYIIQSDFTVVAGKIVLQIDTPVISDLEFARMAAGFPTCLAALTPFFRPKVRKKMGAKLDKVMTASGAKAAAQSNPRG